MAADKSLEKQGFESVPQFGLGGLVTRTDAQNIKDNESPDLHNIVYDGGVSGPRNGTTLAIPAPVGETAPPTQLLKARDSAGNVYLIGVFGANFYVADFSTSAWVKINGTYTPTQSGLFYGSANWNIGSGQDAFYFCNGVDFVMKWIPFFDRLAQPAASTDLYLTVRNANLFPATGGNINVGGTLLEFITNATAGVISINGIMDGNTTLTITINGIAVVITFVSSMGTTAGSVLIGATPTATLANLLGLLQNPSISNTTQYALTGTGPGAVANFTYTLNGLNIVMTPTNTVYSVSGVTTATNTYFTVSNPLNRLGLGGSAVGATIASGTAVFNPLTSVPSIPIGNVLAVAVASGAGFRLFVGGVPGNQSLLYYSKGYSWVTGGAPQEDFTTSASTFSGGAQAIIYGEGGILDLQDFGSYLAVIKANAISSAAFTLDTTSDSTTLVPASMIYGESISPVGQSSDIMVENSLYVVTNAQGIYQFTPASTGAQLSTTLNPYSDGIITLLNKGLISFKNGDREFFNRKIYWLCSTIPGVNNLVLVSDMTFNNWSIWDGLNAVGIKEENGNLYFLCNDDGGLYFLDQNSYQDSRAGNQLGYNTYIFSKRYDWGKPANPKTQSLAMMFGMIIPSTKIYIDVLYGEGGSLATTTYVIDGNGPYVNQVPAFGLGRAALGQNPLGGYQVGTIGFFRVYLDLQKFFAANVIQFKVYGQNAGDNWAMMDIAVNPEVNEKIPPEYLLGIQT